MKLRGVLLRLAGIAALVAVAAIYTRTEVVVMLANIMWTCTS